MLLLSHGHVAPALVAAARRARDQLDWRPRYLDLSVQVGHAWAWRQGNRKQWKRIKDQVSPAGGVKFNRRNGCALKWRWGCALTQGVGAIAFVLLALLLMSGRVRSYIPVLIDRQMARAWPFTYAVVGDSLAAECPWKWTFGLSPLAVANLAAAGADLRHISRQIELARDLRPQVMLISGGINDVITYEAPLDEFRYDFGLLLRGLGKEQRSVVTLIPYTSDRNFTARITAANKVISELSSQRGISIIDINPSLSVDGVRRSDMTTDGIHLSALACRTWIDAVKSRLRLPG